MAGDKYPKLVVTPHGELTAPAWLPDATRAVVRCVDSHDMRECGVSGIVTSAFHLIRQPGINAITAAGGLHGFMSWQGPIVTDSGGFQAYSLIRQNPKQGSITDKAIIFRPDDGDKLILTPEKSVQFQFRCGADIIVCLDDCTHPEDPLDTQKESVARTVQWAKRCKAEYGKQLASRRLDDDKRPLLFAVVQGGNSQDLRRECAARLLEIGFDGYGFGGWPVDEEGNLVLDSLALTRELIPAELPMHALGIGHPVSLVKTSKMGYTIYDCTMPTRDARRKRLYAIDTARVSVGGSHKDWFDIVYLQDEKHGRSTGPIDAQCDCLCCKNYSRGYMYHLARIDEASFDRLATIHNIRCMVRLTQRIGQA
jgi:queuine tRNA-ribosyltransferase